MKLKSMVAGFVMGSICMLTVGVFAGGNLVSATVSDIRFEFDGVYKNISSDYTTPALVYDDRVYVPARFVAEQLGANVTWNDITNTVGIISPEPEVVVKEIIKEIEVIKEVFVQNYESLPIKKETDDFIVTVQSINKGDDYTKVNVRVENKKSIPIVVEAANTYIEVDGVSYLTKDVNIVYRDMKWYNNIENKDYIEGYIIINKIPVESKNMQIELEILDNDGLKNKSTIGFNIKLN